MSKIGQQRSKSTDIFDFIDDLFSEAEKPEDLKVWLLAKPVSCFLCKRELDVRLSKKDRPYLVCDSCQAQFFIRGNKGIERLIRLIQRREE